MIVCLLPMFSNAQVCNIDYTQTVPGIYPDTMPVGTVNQFYDEDITFVLPLDTQGYDFTNFHILSISLPVGLSWECNNSANSCNYDPQVNQYGCVNVYGTPLLAGQYNVDVTVIADLTVATGIPTSFSVFMEILPANVSTTNNGFSMAGASGCSPQTVSFTNNNPGLLAYSWDFGNGNTSTAENPVPQIYSTPGDYEVSYEAWANLDTLEIYTLTNLTIQSMSNYGGGFPAFEDADAYYIIYENGSIFSQSGVIADTDPPVSWSTSLVFDPNQSYTIEIWESDAGEIGFGADDFMGVAPLNLNGCTGCAVGTSVIDYSISYQQILPSPSVISVDTVHVSGYPATPTVSWDSIPHTLTSNDLGDTYQWYFNGSPIAGATDTTYIVQNSGYYHLVAINANGCVSFSDTTLAIYCDPNFEPQITTNGAGSLIVMGSGNAAIQWYLDGNPLQDDTLDVCVPTVAGDYTVTLIDEFGCVFESAPTAVSVGLDQLASLNWNLFPNPAGNSVNIRVDAFEQIDRVEIVDMLGRTVFQSEGFSGEEQIDLSAITNGSYVVRLKAHGQIYTKSLLIHKK